MSRVDLRTISAEALQRELRERRRCVDCGTEWSSAWYPAGPNRVRCAECRKGRPK